jgi:hypothetical protein
MSNLLTGLYEEYNPHESINQLSKLKQERLDTKTIKLTKRGGVSTKKARAITKQGDNWNILKREISEIYNILLQCTNSVQQWLSIDTSLLVHTDITVNTIRSYCDDLNHFKEKLKLVNISEYSGKVTADNHLQYNRTIDQLSSLSNDITQILLPKQAELMFAATILDKYLKSIQPAQLTEGN